MMRLIIATLLSILVCSNSYAVTVSGSSGTITNGNTVTFTGADFGTKTHPEPIRFINFEDGTDGVQIPDDEAGGGLHTVTGVKYSNTYSRGVNSVSARQEFLDGGEYNQEIGLNSASTITTTEVYVSAYYRQDTNGSLVRNAKFLNIATAPFGSGDWASRVDFDNISCDPHADAQQLMTLNATCDVLDVEAYYFGGTEKTVLVSTDSDWRRIETYLNIGTAYRWFKLDNGTVIDRELTHTEGTLITDCTGTDATIGYVYLGHYWDDAPCTSTDVYRYYDEIYIDDTQSRVEICDSSTWAARTHCEIQPPSAWTTNSVSVTLNQGTFAAEDTAYVYIIDSTGDVNASGLEITIGGAATPVNGVCNATTEGQSYVDTCPSSSLCTAGTASSVTNDSDSCDWTCAGLNGGTTDTCTAAYSTSGNNYSTIHTGYTSRAYSGTTRVYPN